MRVSSIAAATAVVIAASFGLAAPASAGTVTLCPNQANIGNFGGTTSFVAGPLDGSCGANSAVKMDIPSATDYARLQFDSSVPGYPSGVTLGRVTGISANVDFTSASSDEPYYMLVFTDGSNVLGQAAATDQILMLEFESSALSGNTLAMDPTSTLFNLYDNTTGKYLQSGQQDTHTLQGWFSLFPTLAGENLDSFRLAEGLAGGSAGPDSLTVNSVQFSSNPVPEPSTIALMGTALFGVGFFGRKRRAKKI